MHELFAHTADLGLRATAASLEELFAEMGRALLAALVRDPAAVARKHERPIAIAGTELELLLFDWLAELLYLFESEKMLCGEWDVRLVPDGLDAVVRGEPFDPRRHQLEHEIKAITYHGLRVDQTPAGWRAEAIVDI